MSKETTIFYDGELIASFYAGQTATLKTKGDELEHDIVVTAGSVPVDKFGLPIEIDSLDNALLVDENKGKVYKCDDKLYQVEKITSLKGLTIKFNEIISSPCPIGEDDVLECSGVPFGVGNYGKPRITAIKRMFDSSSSGTKTLAFDIKDDEYLYDLHYTYANFLPPDDPEYEEVIESLSRWFITDEIENEINTPWRNFVVSDFDCPTLNENPAFIEWVLANGKVCPKIECLNDIKAFEMTHSAEGAFAALQEGYWSAATETICDLPYDGIAGQFTASFSINGKVAAKTFTNFAYSFQDDSSVTFSNDSGDLLIIENNYGEGEVVTKYNGVAIDGTVTFTTFDCIFNDSYFFLSYVLCYCDLIDMDYPNGFYFVEYVPEMNGGIPTIDALDEALLISENKGKIYEYNGKLYSVEEVYVPVKDGEQGTAFFLEDGKMVTPTIPGDYNLSTCSINGGGFTSDYTISVPVED